LTLLFNPYITNTGDQNVFPADNTLQNESSHGGSNFVLFGGTLKGANGQTIADTTSNGTGNSYSWIVGANLGPPLSSSADNTAWGGSATGAARKVYLDTVKFTNGSGFDIQIDAGGTVYRYQSPTTSVHTTGGTDGGAFVPTSPP
jgi:hypothetical protein